MEGFLKYWFLSGTYCFPHPNYFHSITWNFIPAHNMLSFKFTPLSGKNQNNSYFLLVIIYLLWSRFHIRGRGLSKSFPGFSEFSGFWDEESLHCDISLESWYIRYPTTDTGIVMTHLRCVLPASGTIKNSKAHKKMFTVVRQGIMVSAVSRTKIVLRSPG